MNRTENFIKHYGVPGMKWGVRKDGKRGGRKATSNEASTLTNKELKKRVSRLEMEKKYIELTAKRGALAESSTSEAVRKGAGVVASVVGPPAKGAVQEYARGEFTKAITKMAAKQAARKAKRPV